MKQLHFTSSKRLPRLCAIALCAVLVCGLSVSAYAYMAPASYVSMDVNPSIEYTLNRFDRVLSAQAVNEDGARVLQETENLKNKPIDEVIRLTLTEISKEGYFDNSAAGGVVIATSGKESTSMETLAARLQEVAAAQCAENNHTVSVEALSVNPQQRDEAKALGVSAGKLVLVQNMQAENPDAATIITEEWLQKSVREIMAEAERLDDLNDAAEDAADASADAEDAAKDALEDAEDAAADAREDAEDAAAEALENEAEAREDAADAAEEAAEKEREAAEEAADKQRDADDKAKDLAEEAEEARADAEEQAAEARAEAEERAAEAKADAEDAAEDAETEHDNDDTDRNSAE